MKILVTGGAGFIGSAVVRQGIHEGHIIKNIDKLTYAACVENLNSICDHPSYSFEEIDICNGSALKKCFNKFMPDAVMHLAAESHVDRSIDAPSAFIQSNIIGTYELLEASRNYWIKQGQPINFRFHHISTDEVYGSLGKSGLFTESTPYDPKSPYSASKASSDHLVRAWHKTYGLPVIITNCSNNYGPFQFLDAFKPDHICNHSDSQGRYAYNRQPNIAYWNLFCLGQALLPLIPQQEDALAALESYKSVFPAALQKRLRAKLGLLGEAGQHDDKALIESTLKLLAAHQIDHTIFWRRLCRFDSPEGLTSVRDLFVDRAAFDAWASGYAARRQQQDSAASTRLMLATNPKFVLRNHLGEQAIRAAKNRDYSVVNQLLLVLQLLKLVITPAFPKLWVDA